MRVKVTIESRHGDATEFFASVDRDGDLLQAMRAAVEFYRQKQGDLPLFDHSSIRIERA